MKNIIRCNQEQLNTDSRAMFSELKINKCLFYHKFYLKESMLIAKKKLISFLSFVYI